MAYSLALLANFAGLMLSVWLGVYIVTHSRRSLLAWCSGLTLWFLGGVFANTLLFTISNPTHILPPYWLSLFFPIWPQQADSYLAGWTYGLASSLGVFFWYQTTVLIIPGRIAPWRRWSLYLGYAIVIFALFIQIFLPQWYAPEKTDPLLVDTQSFNSIYTVLAFLLIVYSGLSAYNLFEARQRSSSVIVNRQVDPLIVASLLAFLATAISVLGALSDLSVPILTVSTILVVAVAFFGFGVIRYSAIMGNRILRRDLAYSAVAIALVTILYLSVFLGIMTAYRLPQSFVVLLIPMVIITHSITEEVRQVLERLIYDRKTRLLRTSLRNLSQLAGEPADLANMLSRSLEAICSPVRATYGVILLFDQDTAVPTGSYRWRAIKQPIDSKDFEADDVRNIEPGSLPEPFSETTLLIPLYISMKQIGVLLLGRPETGIHYPPEDILLLQGPTEQITDLIIRTRRIKNYLDQIVQLPVQQSKPPAELVPVVWVEDALQNLYNYAYLGDSPLVALTQIKTMLDGKPSTHLDKGKAVNQVLCEVIEKLRPHTALPAKAISREWFPYLILHEAYFEGLPNRDIISKLYISEGTFHRTRRSALRSVARVLSEMEAIT